MARFTVRQYQLRMLIALLTYVATTVLVWPLANHAGNLAAKLLLSLTPVPAVLYAIWLVGKRIWHSDELEQRTHLVGLGVATAVIAVVGLISGFLALTEVFPADVMATILIWIFPIQMICYNGTRWWVARRYGSSLICDESSAIPRRWRWPILAIVMGFVALFAYLRRDPFEIGMLLGMVAAALALGLVKGIGYWRRRREPRHLEGL